MKLPADAIIPNDKLSKYLLIYRPDSDKSKFLAQAGFTGENPAALETAIRQLIAESEAVFDREDDWGTFYSVSGVLKAVDGQDLDVITIWINPKDTPEIYRFVTLKPRKQPEEEINET